MDEGQGGVVLPDSYLALRLDTNQVIPLGHPLETSTLENHGFTWRKASKENRLFRVQFKVCQQCGLLHEESNLHTLNEGCTFAFLSGVAIVFGLKWFGHLAWDIALLAGFLGMVVISNLITWGMRKRKANQESTSRLLECTACHGREFFTIAEAVGRLLPCARCHQPKMRYSIAGKS